MDPKNNTENTEDINIKNKAKKKFTMPKITKDSIIYIVIITLIILYVGFTMFKKPSNDAGTTPSDNESDTNIEHLLDPQPDSNTESKPADTSQKLPYDGDIEASTDRNDIYKYPEGDNIYLDDYDGISTCRVYIPTGYTYVEQYEGSLLLKPENVDLNVTGNAPILLTWFNINYIEKLRNGEITFEDEYSSYTVLDKYEYARDQNNKSDVYVVQISNTTLIHKEDPENPENIISENETVISYRVIVDYNLNGVMYPMFSINSENIHCVINNRYPDIISIAKAIFKPL